MIRILLLSKDRSVLRHIDTLEWEPIRTCIQSCGGMIAKAASTYALGGLRPKDYDAAIVFGCNGSTSKIMDYVGKWAIRHSLPLALWDEMHPQEVREMLWRLMPRKEETMKEETRQSQALTIIEEKTIDGFKLARFEGDDAPRTMDTDLAEKLEMPRPRDIRPLIERHLPALEKIAVVHVRETVSRTSMPRGGERTETVPAYYLTEEQAAYVAAKSEMPKATAITIAMVKVFVAWGRGELPPKEPSTLSERMLSLLAKETEKEIRAAEERGAKALEERVSDEAHKREAQVAALAEKAATKEDVAQLKSAVWERYRAAVEQKRDQMPIPFKLTERPLNAKERAEAKNMLLAASLRAICRAPGIERMSILQRSALDCWAMSLLRGRVNHGVPWRNVLAPFAWPTEVDDVEYVVDFMRGWKWTPPKSYQDEAKRHASSRRNRIRLQSIEVAA